MNVLAINHIETCLDGTIVLSFELDRVVDSDLVRRLAIGRHLQRLADLPRPFYRIRNGIEWECKGIEGELNMRVMLKRDHDNNQATIIALLAMDNNITQRIADHFE